MFGITHHFIWLVALLTKLSVAIDEVENIFTTFQPDLQPFQAVIRTALQLSTNLNTSQCNLPDGGIMYTLSNHHLFPLLVLRQEAMAKKGVLNCLQQRFITTCLDEKCLMLCKAHKFSNCALITMPETPYTAFGAQATSYQKNSYSYIVWLKWETLFSALSVAKEVFYLDADVLLLDNPFPDTRFGRDQTGRRIPGEYEFMYQRERGMKEKGCGGSVNGGLIYLRNSTSVQGKLIPAIANHKQDMIQLTGPSDQDIVGSYAKLVKYCTLPVDKFMGHCVSSQASNYNPKQMITYHTNCVAGLDTKINHIRSFIKRATS